MGTDRALAGLPVGVRGLGEPAPLRTPEPGDRIRVTAGAEPPR